MLAITAAGGRSTSSSVATSVPAMNIVGMLLGLSSLVGTLFHLGLTRALATNADGQVPPFGAARYITHSVS